MASPQYCDNITNPHLWTNTTLLLGQLWHFAVLVDLIFTFYISTSHSIPHYCWCYFLIFSLIEWYQKSKNLLLLRNPFSHFLVLMASIIWYLGSYVRLMVPSSGFILDAEWSLNVRALAWLLRTCRQHSAVCLVLCVHITAEYNLIFSSLMASLAPHIARALGSSNLWKRSTFPIPNFFLNCKFKYFENH